MVKSGRNRDNIRKHVSTIREALREVDPSLDVSDLRGSDELGILAAGLADPLERVKDDLQREQLCAQQERDMWHAVGHEIMSPLQSLMVLHGGPHDPSHRYVRRMQQAVHVLMARHHRRRPCKPPMCRRGNSIWMRSCTTWPIAPTSRACSTWHTTPARAIGPVIVRADAFALEDVVTHILSNADRYRPAGSPITLTLTTSESTASATLHNCGTTIAEDLLAQIFDLGVSAPALCPLPGEGAHRGQGLFVAKTYMAKMGGHDQCAQRGRWRGLHPDLSAPGLKQPQHLPKTLGGQREKRCRGRGLLRTCSGAPATPAHGT